VADWTTPALARPRLPARSSLLPSRRTLTIAAAVVAVIALAYVAARTTPLFAVKRVEVRGAPPEAAAEVETAVARFVGTSLVALDGGELIRRVESLPTVVSAEYDRAFPNTLTIFVQAERPVAVVAEGGTRWLVSERGRVMGRVDAGQAQTYPLIELAGTRALSPGETLEIPAVRVPLSALARVDKKFPVRIRLAALAGGQVILTLGDSTEVRLGEPVDLELKLAAAARVLSALNGEERANLAYLDVSLPERPVAANNPQVVG
jgi:cell division protein FtsQ